MMYNARQEVPHPMMNGHNRGIDPHALPARQRRRLVLKRATRSIRPGWHDGPQTYQNRKYARKLDRHAVELARQSVSKRSR